MPGLPRLACLGCFVPAFLQQSLVHSASWRPTRDWQLAFSPAFFMAVCAASEIALLLEVASPEPGLAAPVYLAPC